MTHNDSPEHQEPVIRRHSVTSPETCIQAGLVHQGYIHEKCHTNRTQNSNSKQCISWGFGDWPHPIQCV